MDIASIIPGYLYAAGNIFPEELLNSINQIDWRERPYERLVIGRGRRRQITHNDSVDQTVNDYCFNVIKPWIEQQCGVKFTQDTNRSFTYWLDEPGFRPSMHTDGDLSTALQIYLQSNGQTDLGTVFYRTNNHNDALHTFESQPNTGYIMFNQPEATRPVLWHDMSRAVPEGVLRLCLYICFGPYVRV